MGVRVYFVWFQDVWREVRGMFGWGRFMIFDDVTEVYDWPTLHFALSTQSYGILCVFRAYNDPYGLCMDHPLVLFYLLHKNRIENIQSERTYGHRLLLGTAL